MRDWLRVTALVAGLALVVGCDADEPAPAGDDTADAAVVDAAPLDGSPVTDADPPDAPPDVVDRGPPDAAPTPIDASLPDATAPDAAPPDATPPDANAPDAAPPAPPPECVALVEATQAFLALLEGEALDLATAPFGDDQHRRFEFLPPRSAARAGLSMRAMDAGEQAALAALLQAAMSASGYLELEEVRQLESALAMAESGQAMTANRDPLNYFIQVFGTPRVDGEVPWGFRFEGHHLSVQAATLGCQLFTATPSFWGASPQITPLRAKVDAATALWSSLDMAQRQTASGPVEATAISAKQGALDPFGDQGVAAADMTPQQVDDLRALIRAYLDTMSAPIAADRHAAIEAAGFDAIRFVYADRDFRVIGPTFVIELVYAGDTHIHSVWRDYDGDYGDDLIARHMAADPHRMDPPD